MNHGELEEWAVRVAEELQDFCNEAQIANGNPDGEDQLPGTRLLLAELDCILNNRPVWQVQITEIETENSSALILNGN